MEEIGNKRIEEREEGERREGDKTSEANMKSRVTKMIPNLQHSSLQRNSLRHWHLLYSL